MSSWMGLVSTRALLQVHEIGFALPEHMRTVALHDILLLNRYPGVNLTLFNPSPGPNPNPGNTSTRLCTHARCQPMTGNCLSLGCKVNVRTHDTVA